MDHSAVTALLHGMSDMPDLADAACRGHHELFDTAMGNDDDAKEAQVACVMVCAACPVLGDCRRWADTLDPRERSRMGVLAGAIPHKPSAKALGRQLEHAIAAV